MSPVLRVRETDPLSEEELTVPVPRRTLLLTLALQQAAVLPCVRGPRHALAEPLLPESP